MSRGCTGKRFGCKLQIGQTAKLNRREIPQYRTRAANTLRQGPVAVETQVAGWRDSGPRVAHFSSSGFEWRRYRAAWALGRFRRPETGDTSGASLGLGPFKTVAGVGFEADRRDWCSATNCAVATCWGLTR